MKTIKIIAIVLLAAFSVFAQENTQTFLSLEGTGVEEFHKTYPEYDGRETIIIILDTGVDIGVDGLTQTSTGEVKFIDVQDFTHQGDVQLFEADVDKEENKTIFKDEDEKYSVIASSPLQNLPKDNKYYIGGFDEARLMNSSSGAGKLNGDGDIEDVYLAKPVRVSASWVVDPPERAVDGDLNNWWGAGGPVPAWIEVDLQGLYSVSRIKIINQGPTGSATYDVYGRGLGYQTQLLHSFPGNKTENQTLEFSPQPAWDDIATIRIEINSGSGWVGFREIQVFSRDEPKPLPESKKEKIPSFLAEVHPDELAPIKPENAIFVDQLAMFGRGPVNEIAWSPVGTTLAVASPLGVWLYDPNDLQAEPILLEGHTRDVLNMIFRMRTAPP